MTTNDNIQHGIDDDPHHDASKGAKLGGVGGVVTGALAGAAAGPAGAVVGAIVGGIAGAVGSGAAVAVVDQFDNDNNISGIGGGINYDEDHYRSDYGTKYASTGRPYETYQPAYRYGAELHKNPDFVYDDSAVRTDFESRNPNHRYDDYSGAIRSGYDRARLGGVGTGVTGTTVGTTMTDNDNLHNGTGLRQGQGSAVGAGTAAETAIGGNGIDGIQTGGHATDGTPDTRGITEKVADKLTGDHVDDKTGKVV